jgi:ABC-2 type transport system permease protein
MHKAWAFLKRDLVTDLSYKLSFALAAVHLLLSLVGYYFLARLLGGTRPDGYDPFPFIAVGVAVNGCMTTLLVCFGQAIRGSQATGTLKAVLTTRTTPMQFILLSSLYPIARAMIDAGLCLLFAAVLGFTFGGVHLGSTLLILALSFLAFSSIGILSAGFALVFQRGDPLVWLFVSASWLLGGVLYPRDMLPAGLQQAGTFLPLTAAVDGLRATLLKGASLGDVLPQIAVLGLFSAVALPASLAAFEFGIRRARVKGSLEHA